MKSMRDVRLESSSELEALADGACEVCRQALPAGRVRCVAHSEYAQAVMRELAARELQARRLELRRARRVA